MHAEDSLNVMKTVLETEAHALHMLQTALGAANIQALDYLSRMQGRVICTGVGKSGHIACKAAATFASTGTPAQFVHATEASHGDLGMIGPDDVCLALSNSGETSELADIITYTRRFHIPLIAITGTPNSTLGSQADVVLALPDVPEACLIGVAPTTSTTATLALCDALAVALMQTKGFAKEDFQVFHPGGKLGAQLVRVDALMHEGSNLPLLAPQTPMGEGLVVMTEKGFGTAGVIDDQGHLAGVVTDGDLRRNLDGLLDKTVADVATPNPKSVTVGVLASEALKIMNDAQVSALFVLNATGHPIGIIHIHDCIRAGIV
ncbi:MAG: KpsF/GutQ family sugar-phosphate isomerase [Pseudomonadota bacterium]